MNPEKLAKLQALQSQARIGGKGTVRRKCKKVHKTAASENVKLQTALKKLNAQTIPAIEEVNLFREDGQVIHFSQPKVQAAVGCNTFVIGGPGEEKELTELAPGILSQLGPNALLSLSKMAAAYQAQAAAAGISVEEFAQQAAARGGIDLNDDDDQVPDLVSNFEAANISH